MEDKEDSDLYDNGLRPLAPEMLAAGILELAQMRAMLSPKPTRVEARNLGARVALAMMGGII